MIRVVDLFCGVGGFSLGLHAAADELGIDVRIVDAIDVWEPAVNVYNRNQRHPVARVADVKQLTRADLPPHDLLIGGAPCQQHSCAGKRDCFCEVGGTVHPKCCLADFARLAATNEWHGPAWLMENVAARLIDAPWSERLCAADFGDVTSRKRWFYSNYLLHVREKPGPRRIRDIRDFEEDRRVGHVRHAPPGAFPLALRSYSGSAKAFSDDDFLDTLLTNSWHANEATKIAGCRNPSVLEMARAHGIPDSWDWASTTKTQRAQMIANAVPRALATAVCKAMLAALAS